MQYAVHGRTRHDLFSAAMTPTLELFDWHLAEPISGGWSVREQGACRVVLRWKHFAQYFWDRRQEIRCGAASLLCQWKF